MAVILVAITGTLAYLYFAPPWPSDESPSITKRHYLIGILLSVLSGMGICYMLA